MNTARATMSDAGVSREAFEMARVEAMRIGLPLFDVLQEQLGAAPDQLVRGLGSLFQMPTLSSNDMHALTPAFDVISFEEAQRREVLPLRDADGNVVVVLKDPLDTLVHEWAETLVEGRVHFYLAHPADIAALRGRLEDDVRTIDAVLPQSGRDDDEVIVLDDLSFRAIHETDSHVIKLVSSTIYDGIRQGASDIHIERDPVGLVIKYRIDGVLTKIGQVNGISLAEQVLSRIKVMSDLDIAERRVPQDGRFKLAAQGREIDFRVSVMPSLHGEDAVLRILDRRAIADEVRGLRLDILGFDPGITKKLHTLIEEPFGMVLVTGPTGSGKTTTLYAALTEINTGYDKIITIEDPVEYQLSGVLQIPVNERKGLTFARGLRSILRHDPDKIMVGEIRDEETAQIAVQSALTGHLVLTTVHANNAFDVIGRFIHMGVDIYSFVAALKGALAQRLVRLICTGCAAEHFPTDEVLIASGIDPALRDTYSFKIGRGCGLCHGTGYRGRRAIGELMILTDELREQIVGRASLRDIKRAARHGGMTYLRDSAIDLVKQGLTTLQEINRVTVAEDSN
jgi:general secretion pathway protein E